LEELYCVIQDRQKELPDNSYTTRLISEGVERVAQKVIEEAGETALAAVVAKRDSLPGEVADLLYHVLVLIAIADVTTEQVWEELRMRRGGKG
jgi:phosphoribosyl-ATP pyrophosphohydrolase